MQDKPALTAGQLRDMLAYLPYDAPVLIALSRDRVIAIDIELSGAYLNGCNCPEGDCECPDTEIFLRTQ